MQALFNLMAFVGFVLSGSMTAALLISYQQMDAIQQKAVQRITEQVIAGVEKELDSVPNPFAKP